MTRAHIRARYIVLVIVVVIAVCYFAVLPPLARKMINDKLNSEPGMSGHVRDVSFNLFAGKMNLAGLKVTKTEGKNSETVEVPELGARIHLKALLRRIIVADVSVLKPVIHIYNREEGKPSPPPTEVQKEVKQELKKKPRFRVDHFEVVDGKIYLHDSTKKPNWELYATGLNANLTNLSNSKKATNSLFAGIDIDALVMDSGSLHVTGAINPVATPPEFKLTTKLKDLDITKLNPMLMAEKDLHIEHGRVDAASEVATKNGNIDGYVKPVIHELQVANFKKDVKKGLGHALKEQVLGAAGQVAKNLPEEKQGARIPFHGKLDDPKVSMGDAIGSVLHNMFVQAIVPNIEHSVSIEKAGKQKE